MSLDNMIGGGVIMPTSRRLRQYQIVTSWCVSPEDEEEDNHAGIINVSLDDLQDTDLLLAI
ncbi:hypothetical protein JAAARDRAFT_194861 [Jaapia argillacea MUCL 33604]|uniref:Uncharacterized protein n=1 Tax=Jaapia argillacea MUCL 33604 TaxID=933084 RepID=A0A067PQ38_9AGAM|nr:hypothetical protein JAAARDRAFT_194861 [Jaapia argillacea MUCL 33604]